MGLRGPKPRREGVYWSPELSYAVGLLASDGCLSPSGRHLVFVSKDLEQVTTLKRILAIAANISVSTIRAGNISRKYYRLQWGDITLYKFLLDIGMTPNKSLSLGSLKIPDEYFLDFLRGSFDGDGSFSSYYDRRWKSSFLFYLTFVSASEEHIQWIRHRISALLGVRGHMVKPAKSSVYQLRFGKAESVQVLKGMYKDDQAPSLSRKRLKINEAMAIVSEPQFGAA